MAAANTLYPHTPRPQVSAMRHEPETHLFRIGQAVRLRGRFGVVRSTEDIYVVTATLPPLGDRPQYRIRSDDERYERVATQDNLEPVHRSPGGGHATLAEQAFGHGEDAEDLGPNGQAAPGRGRSGA